VYLEKFRNGKEVRVEESFLVFGDTFATLPMLAVFLSAGGKK
jgi:hypothetical protein